MKYNHIDLFSGIGGFSLACKWNGIETVQFVEKDERCRNFLSRAWPGVPIHDDIKTFHYSGGPVFLLTGGVPCQPASRAGKQRGKADDRWLWGEAVRVLAEVNPTWALFENPPGIGDVGLSGILSDVEACGYEVRVVGIPACAVGSPQIRMRYWIVAHRCGEGCEGAERSESFRQPGEAAHGAVTEFAESLMADRDERGSENGSLMLGHLPGSIGTGRGATDHGATTPVSREGLVADSPRRQDDIGRDGDMAETEECGRGSDSSTGCVGEHMGDTANSPGRILHEYGQTGEPLPYIGGTGPWDQFIWMPCADGKVRRAVNDLVELVNGVSVDLFEVMEKEGWPETSLIGALGNSIVPQVASAIIAAIVRAENESE